MWWRFDAMGKNAARRSIEQYRVVENRT